MISQWRRRQVVGGLLLTFVTLIGATLRLQALAEPLWVDELHTGWVVSGAASELSSRAHDGNQAATYFYVPWLSTRVWGSTPFGLRFPSLVAGIALIPLAGSLVWRWSHSAAAGVVTATLLAIDRNFVFYGVEARVYVLLQLVGLLHLGAFVADQRRPSWRSAALWLGSGLLLFYLHYTTVLVVAGEFVLRSRNLRQRWRALLRDLAVLAVGVLPAVPNVAEVAARRRNWGEMLSADPLSSLFPWGAGLAVPLLCVGLVAGVRRLRRQPPWWRTRRTPLVGLLASVLVIPVLVALIATEAHQAQLLRFRYLIVPATFFPVLTGLLVALAPSRRSNYRIATFVLALALPSSELWLRWTTDRALTASRREDWSAAINRINGEEATRHWPVLLCGGLVEDRQLAQGASIAGWPSREALVAFCRFPLRSVPRLDRPDDQIVPLPTMAEPRTTPAVRQAIADAGGAWLVVRGRSAAAGVIATAVRREWSASGTRLEVGPFDDLGGVTLARFQVRPAADAP